MWVTEFPDNSIACHANRVTGGSQDVFVSGAALAVDCGSDTGFFPDIYNEDWLFFFDAASSGELGNSYLKATQLYYYPFANAERAAWQEFGDVLAEGLYALLHLGVDVAQATSQYWEAFLEARRNFLEATLTRAQVAPLDMRDEIIASLHSAMKSLSGIRPDLCTRYVEAWRQDLRHWRLRWAGIKVMPSVDAALAELGLATTPTDSPKRVLHPQDRPVLPPTPGLVTIPEFGTLRELAQHYSEHRLSSPPAEKRSTRALSILVREEKRTQSRSRLISRLHMTVISCQIAAMRIFSRRRVRTRP